jgi:hypothetical protein
MENSLPTLIADKVLMSSRVELINGNTRWHEGLLWVNRYRALLRHVCGDLT